MSEDRPTRVAVVVLGDLGRSPRMQYHAAALADAGAEVALIGVTGHEPFARVREHPRIRVHRLRDVARPVGGRGLIARAAGRAARQAGAMLAELGRGRPPYDVILVQNPPAVPTLAAAWLAARRHRARLVIDWHNLGYAMVAQRLGAPHPLVRLAARYERALGRRAAAHLCVSRAMQRALAEQWDLTATVLYDRPAAQFAPRSAAARADSVRALCARVGLRAEGRPALIVSPTSWTEDDDVPLLLEALPLLDARLGARGGPPVLVLMTGTGPLRARYDGRLAARRGDRVHAHALWLSADEYPDVLGAADLGLSVHRSASGLDLPMKIADLFGAGVPVCALDYGPCLREIVRPGEDAVLFGSAAGLAGAIDALLAGFPSDTTPLDRLRAGAAAAAAIRWDGEWLRTARPVLLGGA